MNNLLRANFARLIKSKSLWVCAAAMAAISVGLCLSLYQSGLRYDRVVSPDKTFFYSFLIAGILIPVVCSLFIGAEYSDGTIRNKLVVGHGRGSLYLANFITCAAASLLILLTYLAVTLLLGALLLGGMQMEASTILMLALVGLLLTVAHAAIYTLLSMLNQNKTVAAIVGILPAFAALFFTSYLLSRLQEPEFYQPYTLIVDGAVQETEPAPNPNYLNDAQRAGVQFLLDIMPTGQAMQLANTSDFRPEWAALYSVVIILAGNIVGIVFFRRKDIK